MGLGRDFWDRLYKVAAPYLELEQERERLARSSRDRAGLEKGNAGNPRERKNDVIRLCKARAKAIAAAKAEFGEEIFLRVLYEAVAPTVHLTYALEDELEDELRFLEGGCR